MPHTATSRPGSEVVIGTVSASAYRVPTDRPEADGTLDWDTTTIVVAEASGGGVTGLGYSYTHDAAVRVIHDLLGPVVAGCPAVDVDHAWTRMRRAVRNVGHAGLIASAMAAVDVALWDLKSRLLGLSLLDLLGAVRPAVPVYASGGFTSYSVHEIETQLAGWIEQGIGAVKMKVGRDDEADPDRVRAARRAIGHDAALFVDANGAWTPARAIEMAQAFSAFDVRWFEEPVSSDDLPGLARVRGRAPAGCEIAAGEYGYDLAYFGRMITASAVDVLQADATRCAGITGFLRAGHLCDAFAVPLSAHTAPALHAAPCCALSRARHVEYFHDHVRIEARLFDGVPSLSNGALVPDRTSPGLGLTFKHTDASAYRVA